MIGDVLVLHRDELSAGSVVYLEGTPIEKYDVAPFHEA